MASSPTPAAFGPMPKRRRPDESVDVFVRVSAAHAELLADLLATPARARAGRLRLLATLALRPSGPPAAAAAPPRASMPPAATQEQADAPTSAPITPQRQRVKQLKGRLLA